MHDLLALHHTANLAPLYLDGKKGRHVPHATYLVVSFSLGMCRFGSFESAPSVLGTTVLLVY